jgi:hypothetical protein
LRKSQEQSSFIEIIVLPNFYYFTLNYLNMKQKTFPGITLFAFIVALGLFGCTKAGPAGPAGQSGAQGPQGPTGNTGPQGDTGTANVIYSNWVSGFSGTIAYWSVPDITTGVLDSSVVLVYERELNAVVQLPFSNPNGSGFYVIDLLTAGQISIYCDASDNLSEFSFRYVIIPGGVAAQYAHLTYQQISSKFRITP